VPELEGERDGHSDIRELCEPKSWKYYETRQIKQESPAVADKPARHKSMPKITPIQWSYNVVADNTGLSSFV